jgi:hypothetical protein
MESASAVPVDPNLPPACCSACPFLQDNVRAWLPDARALSVADVHAPDHP